MQVASICTRAPVSVDETSSLSQAARLMRDHHVGSLVVTSRSPDGPRVFGIVTDRDLVIDALARDAAVDKLQVGDLAHTTVVLVSEDADLADAVAAMRESGVRRLLVKDADNRLTGVISLDDLIKAYADEFAGLAAISISGLRRESQDDSGRKAVGAAPLHVPAIGTLSWARVVV